MKDGKTASEVGTGSSSTAAMVCRKLVLRCIKSRISSTLRVIVNNSTEKETRGGNQEDCHQIHE